MMGTMVFETLDDALADVARRSFHEGCTVRRAGESWEVSDAYATGVDGEWSYDSKRLLKGESTPPIEWAHSGIHDACETYVTAEHIRYNMSDSVERLESGETVGFYYAVVDTDMDHPDYEADPEGLGLNEPVGWLLIGVPYGYDAP